MHTHTLSYRVGLEVKAEFVIGASSERDVMRLGPDDGMGSTL